MRVVSVLVMAGVVVGCFGGQTAVMPVEPERKEQTQPAAISSSAPTQEQTSSPMPAEPSSVPTPQPVVVADGSGAQITDIHVGDPALEQAMQFTIDRAAKVAIPIEASGGLRLFQVRTDQFGQTVEIGDVQGNEAALPSAGTFRVVGKEKMPSFAEVPLGGDMTSSQYHVQSADCPPLVREIKRTYGGYPASVMAWTRDTEFPPKVKIYLHRGAGNSDDPVDSFQNWVDYNQTRSPDKSALAERVKAYVPDPWDSGPAPSVAANQYSSRRINCGTPGEVWIDTCHSMGCVKTWLALLQEDYSRWNNIGAIMVAPAIGGSHLAIDGLTKASLAINYREKAIHWGGIRSLVQAEWGMLLPRNKATLFLKDLLAGSRISPYSEGARSLAWTGIGTGIPSMSYPWYSPFSFGTPHLPQRLKPEVRYTMPWESGGYNESAPGSHTWQDDGKMYNFIEAVAAKDLQTKLSDGTLVTDGKFDVAICYLNEGLASHSAKIREFEARYIATDSATLNSIWRTAYSLVNKKERRRFAQEALPWMSAVIAMSPSVIPNDPNPNENAFGDGALTACQQIGCLDGQSIVAPGSKYGALIINRGAMIARKPHYVDQWKDFPGRSHQDAVSGEFDDDKKGDGDQELWDWKNSRVIARVDRLWKQDRVYVLTNEDKRRILDTVGPYNGDIYLPTDWDGSRHLSMTHYRLSTTSVQWIQDPLGTGQKSRIRLIGKGTMYTSKGWYNGLFGDYDYGATKTEPWDVAEDFIARQGALLLVVN